MSRTQLHFDEATTRKRLIDAQLSDVGWTVGANGANTSEVTQEEKVEHQPLPSGAGYADYVLWDDNGNPLAVIEAKKTSVDPELGRQQAKLYADGLEKMHGHRPVIFYTTATTSGCGMTCLVIRRERCSGTTRRTAFSTS